jgi:hypothetical protein
VSGLAGDAVAVSIELARIPGFPSMDRCSPGSPDRRAVRVVRRRRLRRRRHSRRDRDRRGRVARVRSTSASGRHNHRGEPGTGHERSTISPHESPQPALGPPGRDSRRSVFWNPSEACLPLDRHPLRWLGTQTNTCCRFRYLSGRPTGSGGMRGAGPAPGTGTPQLPVIPVWRHISPACPHLPRNYPSVRCRGLGLRQR